MPSARILGVQAEAERRDQGLSAAAIREAIRTALTGDDSGTEENAP